MTENLPAKKEPTVSERFTSMIVKEFSATGAITKFSEKQRRLAQHLFVKVDSDLKALEKKRAEKNPKGAPIVWQNVNMNKLALDAVHRIELGLDALIPNHISTIPYFNTRESRYDIDLRIGYVGKDYYRREMATEKPVEIIYELVHKNDLFIPKKRSLSNPIESYEFEVSKPFDRGPVIGGFGYIMYEDQRKNKLVIVTDQDFKKSEKAAKGDSFWTLHTDEMKYKTIVNRVTSKIQIDPDKVGVSYMAVEADEIVEPVNPEATVQAEIDAIANGDFIDIKPEAGTVQPAEMTPEEMAEIQAQEAGAGSGPGW